MLHIFWCGVVDTWIRDGYLGIVYNLGQQLPAILLVGAVYLILRRLWK